jgi:hypothetical protein
MKRLLISMFLMTIAAFAADLNGTWKATAEGPQGSLERTFVFKVDGARLTGETTSAMLGKSTIADGKIDGDSFSFSITASMQGNEMKLTYKGKVTGNEIKVTSQISGDGGGQAIEWTGKKVQ